MGKGVVGKEQTVNVLGLLRPKYEITYLTDEDVLEDALEVLRESGFTAVPVLRQNGQYVGSISEGDFLWAIVREGETVLQTSKVKDILRRGWNPATDIRVSMEKLLMRSANQNFIPVVDDRRYFVGIVTRKDIITTFGQKAKPQPNDTRSQEILAAGMH
ncbi:MAG: CBS domain-containing protein [Lachnospiraceae bacterium]|nr:CBS domain-containing protein [Lachnospiraceae bacterium]